jgi:hypothetical protein
MKIATVLSAATLVVALGLAGAYAQSPGSETGPGGPPAAAPSGDAGGPGGEPDLGSDMGPAGPGPGAMQDDQGGPGLAGPKGDQPPMSAEGEGKAKGKAGTKAEGDVESEGDVGTQAEDKGDVESGGKAGTKAEGDIESEGKAGATAEGQKPGKAGKSVRLESQQVSKVKTYFSEHKPSVKAIDKTEVSVSIGVALPGAIVLYDLPPDVIVVSGACPIKYFVWGDDIVLVDSCTREVVEIIVGVA